MTADELKTKLSELQSDGACIALSEIFRRQPKETIENHKDLDFSEEQLKELSKKYPLKKSYQLWYTTSVPLIRQLIPDRLIEFRGYYEMPQNRKSYSWSTYTIQDYLTGTIFTAMGDGKELKAFYVKFENQREILNAATGAVDSALANIKGTLQFSLFQHELDAADDLKKKGHLRAAGALAGVMIESHLATVCENHHVTIPKKNPTIGDFNDTLKATDIVDQVTWRLIQRLADLRNLCVHAKKDDPRPDDVGDLLSGARKILAEII